MRINDFFAEYVKEINYLMNAKWVRGRKNLYDLEPSNYTFCFNIAVFEIVRKRNLCLSVESETFRAGATDISIYNENEKDKILEIEHENLPWDRPKKGKFENKLEKSVVNLLESEVPAPLKVVISFYHKTYYPKNSLINDFLKYVNKHTKDGSNIYLILSKDAFNDEKDFELIDSTGHTILKGEKLS